METLLNLRISHVDIHVQSLQQHNEKKSTVELKIEKNKNRMEKKLKGKMSKKEKKVFFSDIQCIFYDLYDVMSCPVMLNSLPSLHENVLFRKSHFTSRAGTKCY